MECWIRCCLLALCVAPGCGDGEGGTLGLSLESRPPRLPVCAPGVDFLGFSDALDKTLFDGGIVTGLSGLSYDDRSRLYYAVMDRSGTIPSHFYTLDLPFLSGIPGSPRVLDRTYLFDKMGTPYGSNTWDGEGIAVAGAGNFWIASEGGSAAGEQPEIRLFTPGGREVASLTVPSIYLIGAPGGGTVNETFESLSLTPSGFDMYTANEEPLLFDGMTTDRRKRIRILRYRRVADDRYDPFAQYYYLTESGRSDSDVGVSEIIAVTDSELLVLERGFVSGLGNTLRIYRTSLRGAADVSMEPKLSAAGLVPLAKHLLVDLENCPPSGAVARQPQPNPLLDNFEGMTLGPVLSNGRRALVIISDDNTNPVQITRFIFLGVACSLIYGYGPECP